MVSLASVLAPDTGLPSLRRHVRGGFFVRIPSGGSKWFGSDPDQALKLYEAWKAGFGVGYSPPMRTVRAQVSERRRQRIGADMEHLLNASLNEIADFFVARKTAEISHRSRQNWKQRLKPLKDQLGHRRLVEIKPMHLDAFRATLTKKAPTWSNTILSHTRCFLGWSWQVGLVETPFRMDEVLKDFKRKPIPYKGKPAEVVAQVIRMVNGVNPELARAMLIQYLCCLRPSECPRLLEKIRATPKVQKTYLIYSKTSNKMGSDRAVLISDQLMPLIQRMKKDNLIKGFMTENSYRLGLRRAGWELEGWSFGERKNPEALSQFGWKTLTAHWLRHASVQQAVDLDLPEGHQRLIMGRGRPLVDRAYVKAENLEPARKSIGRLTEFVPVSVVS